MTYQPTPILTAKVGEERAWTVDSEGVETLKRIAELLEQIQQQLELVTGVNLEQGSNS